jgi:D-serine deaminase-like pyridoxal phosphate-dependent protein
MREEEIDTPALVIDLDAFEYNLDTMAALLAPTGAKLRAHAKTHKSPVIAGLQMARGAVGNCVQKVAEAEALAWGGISNILVSNEVVGAQKLARLCALSRISQVAVCADDAGQVAAIEAAAAHAGIRMTVLVEIDVGAGRCGVAPDGRATEAARAGLRDRRRRRDRHVRDRVGVGHLQRDPGRQLRVHGCRLRPQPR